MKKSWRKLAPWLRWTILLVGGFFLLLFLIVLVEHIRGARQLAAWKAAMIAKGEKLTVEELRPKPPLPEDNGVWLMLGALTALERNVGSGTMREVDPPARKFVSPTRRIPSLKIKEWSYYSTTNDWSTLSQVMTGTVANVEQLRVAVAKPALNFGVSYRGFDEVFPHLSKMKDVARCLAVAALYEAHRGNLDGAVSNQEATVALLVKYRQEKLLISQLVGIAGGTIGLSRTWDILQAEGWTDAQLARLQAAWNQPGAVDSMLDAMSMERNMNLHEFARISAGDSVALEKMYDNWRQLSGGNDDDSTNPLVILASQLHMSPKGFVHTVELPLWRLAYADQAACHLASTWQDYIDLARLKIAEPARVNYSSEPKFMEMIDTLGTPASATGYDRLRFWPGEMLGASVRSLILRPTMFEAERELTVTAIALKRYRLRNGKYPDTLAALVPEFLAKVPVDIYTGQPMHYRPEPDGTFLLYSVGEDGKDDLGQQGNYFDGRSAPADLIWPHPASPEQIEEWEKHPKRF